jgi:hypothetical protein
MLFFSIVTLKKTPQRVRPWKNLEGALKHDELVYCPFNFSYNHHTHTVSLLGVPQRTPFLSSSGR